jgi:soluble lytic murein transglycosylase
MSARPAATARRPTAAHARSRARRGAAVRRRRRNIVLAVLGLGILGFLLLRPVFEHAVQEIKLPLRHEDIIRQQARDKRVDPALVAAVIYAESRFRDQTSSAGARGLMQITPATAHAIAQRSGGTQFEEGDLSSPQINIAYGTYYLRLLLDKYDGSEVLALAAYNAGQTNVDRWIERARAGGERFRATSHIPFAETRAYVDRVLQARKDYRSTYPRELGLR